MVLLIAVLCLTLTGCSNAFAREEYNSTGKIAENDRYAALGFNQTGNSHNSVTWHASSFDGRVTVWTVDSSIDYEHAVTVTLSVSKGQAKLVLVDGYGDVTTVAECGEDDEPVYVDAVVPLTWGENKFKLVGYGCKDADVQITLNNDSKSTSNV